MESPLKWCASIALLLLAVCMFIEKGLAIDCYICNSYHHGDDCRYLPEERRSLYEQNCDDLGGNKTYNYCRKMFQDLKGDHRYIRQCAVLGENGCITRSGTRNVRITYCHCQGHLCNHGNTPLPHLAAYVTVAMATLFLPRMYHAFRG